MRTRLTECWTLQRRVYLERAFIAACIMALTLVFTAPALADSVRVAVIHDTAHDEAARRLRAEVSAAGLDALDVPVSVSEPRTTAQLVLARRAVAALRIEPDGDLEILVIDLQTGDVLDRTLLPAQASVAELELTAVEDLRAKLVELAIVLPSGPAEAPAASLPVAGSTPPAPTQPKASSTNPTSMPEAPARAQRDRERSDGSRGIWLQAAAGGALSEGGLSANAVTRLGIRVEPWQRWSVSALSLLPINSQKVSTATGRATANTFLFGSMLGFAPLRSQTAEFELGVGGGAALCQMRGFPSSPLDEGRTQSIWSGVAMADTSFAWRATRWLRIRIAVLAGLAAPRPAVRFEGESVATWGRPFASGTLGVELESLRLIRGAP